MRLEDNKRTIGKLLSAERDYYRFMSERLLFARKGDACLEEFQWLSMAPIAQHCNSKRNRLSSPDINGRQRGREGEVHSVVLLRFRERESHSSN